MREGDDGVDDGWVAKADDVEVILDGVADEGCTWCEEAAEGVTGSVWACYDWQWRRMW
jgi:hypothetical protein